jgi:hypothetical protein
VYKAAMGVGGAQRSVLRTNEPKNTVARSEPKIHCLQYLPFLAEKTIFGGMSYSKIKLKFAPVPQKFEALYM